MHNGRQNDVAISYLHNGVYRGRLFTQVERDAVYREFLTLKKHDITALDIKNLQDELKRVIEDKFQGLVSDDSRFKIAVEQEISKVYKVWMDFFPPYLYPPELKGAMITWESPGGITFSHHFATLINVGYSDAILRHFAMQTIHFELFLEEKYLSGLIPLETIKPYQRMSDDQARELINGIRNVFSNVYATKTGEYKNNGTE